MRIGNIECYGIVYKITNTINGKCYIGQTTLGFNKRYNYSGRGVERVYKLHKNYKDTNKQYNEHLLNSIEKYGFDAFEIIEIFDIAFSREELNIKEINYIRLFDSYRNGYNNTLGGEGKNGYVANKETIEKQREVRKQWWNNLTDEEYEEWHKNLYITKGEKNPMFGKGYLFEGKNNPFYGKHHTDETKKKLSEANGGENNYWYNKKGKEAPNTKSVICLTTNKIFYTAREGAKFYNTYPGNIGKCCQGKCKSSGKLPDGTKLIWMYLEEFLSKCEYIEL